MKKCIKNMYLSTKLYKIIRIDSEYSSIIINICDFCEILLNSYLRLDNINSLNLKLKLHVNYNVRTVELYKNTFFLLKLTYSKCKLILKNILHIYKSHVINLQNFYHIENKKKEIDNIFRHFKCLRINCYNFNDNIYNKHMIDNISNILFDKNICNKLLYLYVLNIF